MPSDAPAPTPSDVADAAMVVLFDGVCNLCNASVGFIIPRDPAARFRFAPLQSGVAAKLLSRSNHAGPLPDSIVLLEGRRVYTRSTAALRVAKRLRFPWPLLYIFIAMPRPLRDWLYDMIARHRYRWFGRRDVCMMPTPQTRSRFLA